MDRMTNARPEAAETANQPELLDPSTEWLATTTLGDMQPEEPLVMVRDKTTIYTTPRELIHMARMPAWMTLEQVRVAFSTPDDPKDNVVPIWRRRLPRGW